MSEQTSDEKRKARNKRMRELYGSPQQPREKTAADRISEWWNKNMTYKGRVGK